MDYSDEILPDYNTPGSAGVDENGSTKWDEMNKGVTPVFHRVPIKDEAASLEAGRPIFRDTEVVELLIAGDQFNRPSGPVTEETKRRFSEQYRRWKERGIAKSVNGTPLREWPLLSTVNVAEFEALEIYSVEALANLPDTSLGRALELRTWREKAKAFIEVAKNSASATKYAEENVRLRDDIGQLKETARKQEENVERMMARISELEAKKKAA